MAADRRVLEEQLDRWVVEHPDVPMIRLLFRLPVVLWRLGLGPLLARVEVRRGHLVMLTVRGRSSGVPRHTPVTAHDVRGRTYLWCPYGDHAQWYRNLMADPIATVQGPRAPQAVRAFGIDGDGDEAVELVAELHRFDARFLRSYLAAQGIAETPDDIAKNARRLHIRRLEPTEEAGPPPLEADLAWLWLVPAAAVVWGLGWRRRRAAIARSG